MTELAGIARWLGGATLAQAARVVELAARVAGRKGEVGRDTYPGEEPIHFVASDRMSLPANDIAEIEVQGDQVRITANVLGLAGATPALPPVYSELQLQRRRLRDFSFGRFLNLFDHRALSFFYRITRKYSWPLQAERVDSGQVEPIGRAALALAGFGVEGARTRLRIEDAALVPLAAHLGDARRSADSVETVLRVLTGLDLRVVEANPVWMAVPPAEQTRLGGAGGQFARLGGDSGLGLPDAAMIGAAVLEVQHHYVVEIGPVSHAQLQRFCMDPEARRVVGELCALAAGIEHRPSIRILVPADDIPPLTLAGADAPALLGWTSWLGPPEDRDALVGDCVIPIENSTIH
ncbi:type VI secretion system baseplate subunit TssG [Sphingomonas sp. dw_22]|uniref:type VI secretion system baseplate subunit TssG n=1 Tax=Sphingomonas sp. dw_22 TaxID=2721175 RepID=UPI001BD2F4E8|nr:type VI secretion system baseplate subunit TssG [Sphingomonas sp. dw_22]